jgi:RecA/RadA recombinase
MDAYASTPLAHVALRPKDHALLGRGGFRRVGDLVGVPVATAAASMRVDAQTAQLLLEQVEAGAKAPAWRTARELEHDEHTPVVSFCRGIDELLGGGASPGKVLEICGEPGVGKTQLLLQFCVDATIPSQFCGAGGASAYVDADGSFAPARCAQLAKEVTRHVHRLARKQRSDPRAYQRAAQDYSEDACLDGIHVYRALDHSDVVHAIARAAQLPGLKLLVVDSVAAHLRTFEGDPGARIRLVTRLALDLAAVARAGVAVVVSNQLASNLTSETPGPALGEAWSHACDERLMLRRDGSGRRSATLVKSTARAVDTAPFVVDERGVRDASRKRRATGSSATNASA